MALFYFGDGEEAEEETMADWLKTLGDAGGDWKVAISLGKNMINGGILMGDRPSHVSFLSSDNDGLPCKISPWL